MKCLPVYCGHSRSDRPGTGPAPPSPSTGPFPPIHPTRLHGGFDVSGAGESAPGEATEAMVACVRACAQSGAGRCSDLAAPVAEPSRAWRASARNMPMNPPNRKIGTEKTGSSNRLLYTRGSVGPGRSQPTTSGTHRIGTPISSAHRPPRKNAERGCTRVPPVDGKSASAPTRFGLKRCLNAPHHAAGCWAGQAIQLSAVSRTVNRSTLRPHAAAAAAQQGTHARLHCCHFCGMADAWFWMS